VSSVNQVPVPEVPAKARTRSYSAAHEAKVLDVYELLDKAGKGLVATAGGPVYVVDRGVEAVA
jgi:transposase